MVYNPFTISVRKFLEDNSFRGNKIIAQWIANVFAIKLATGNIQDLESTITEEVKIEMKSGDIFYVNTFCNRGLINEQTNENESKHPLTNAVKNIYTSLILEGSSEHEKLVIYNELRYDLENIVGEMIAKESTLQQYEHWIKIVDKIANEHCFYTSWADALPIESINAEKHKYSVIPANTKLSDLANIHGYSKNNEEATNNYLAYIAEIKEKPLVEYLKLASRSSEILHLKGHIYLRQHLLKRISFKEWIQFIDSLVYPNLQDHIFLWIDKLSEYEEIIRTIMECNSLVTPKEHLLIISFENYYNFLDRTLTDLYGIISKRENVHNTDEISDAIDKAESEYSLWIEKYIPESFQVVLNLIFHEKELRDSKFFITFFEWINSHSTLYFTNPSVKCKVKLIDQLNEIFIKRLTQNLVDIEYLINNIQTYQVNYEALKKFVSKLEDNKLGTAYRDNLFDLYKNFIESEAFGWTTEGNVDFASAINNTYYFSKVLAEYTDYFKRWESLLHQYKTNHDGWQKTFPDHKIYQRESFLFCAGIGIAYRLFDNEQENTARDIFSKVMGQFIKQLRNSGDMNSIDYLTPIKFASITIGSFDIENADTYLLTIAQNCDKLMYILVALHDLLEYHPAFIPSKKLSDLIRQRIDNEFWIIANKKSEKGLKTEFDYYTQLKDIAIENCLRTS